MQLSELTIRRMYTTCSKRMKAKQGLAESNYLHNKIRTPVSQFV